MTICLQKLESMFAQNSPVEAPDPVLPAPAARHSTRIAGALFADQVGSPKFNEGTDGDKTSSNPDDKIIPPHPTKNPPIKSVPHDPSKTYPHASKDAAGGRHALDGEWSATPPPMPVGSGGEIEGPQRRILGIQMNLHRTLLSVGPMFWPPFNQSLFQKATTSPTPTQTTMITPTNKASTKAPHLVVPGGLSLRHFDTSRLNLVNLIMDQASSCPAPTLHCRISSQ